MAVAAAQIRSNDDAGIAVNPVRFTLPEPTGHHRVGVRLDNVLDENAEASRSEPAAGASREQNVPTGTADDLTAARRAQSDQRRFLVEFFERYL